MGITWRKRRKSSGKTEAYGQYGSSVAKVLGWVRLRNLSARDVVVNSKEMNAGRRPGPGGYYVEWYYVKWPEVAVFVNSMCILTHLFC